MDFNAPGVFGVFGALRLFEDAFLLRVGGTGSYGMGGGGGCAVAVAVRRRGVLGVGSRLGGSALRPSVRVNFGWFAILHTATPVDVGMGGMEALGSRAEDTEEARGVSSPRNVPAVVSLRRRRGGDAGRGKEGCRPCSSCVGVKGGDASCAFEGLAVDSGVLLELKKAASPSMS